MMKKDNNVVIIQITDTHIVSEGKYWKNDSKAKTAERLELVIDNINKLPIQPDIIIHTGDIVDDGETTSYKHAKRLLDNLKSKYVLICGNHDNYENLKQVFVDHNYLLDFNFSQYILDFPGLSLILLDTTVVNKEYGELCDYRIEWLETQLQKIENPIMIFMHHFPLDVKNKLFDRLNLIEKEKLLSLITSNPNVIGLYCGHYHYFKEGVFAKRICWISPSVAPTYVLKNNGKDGLNYSYPSYSIHSFNQGKVVSKVQMLL